MRTRQFLKGLMNGDIGILGYKPKLSNHLDQISAITVIDGDTVDFFFTPEGDCATKAEECKERVRLNDVDAYERSTQKGKRATELAKYLFSNCEKFDLVLSSVDGIEDESGRYGRTLGQIVFSNVVLRGKTFACLTLSRALVMEDLVKEVPATEYAISHYTHSMDESEILLDTGKASKKIRGRRI